MTIMLHKFDIFLLFSFAMVILKFFIYKQINQTIQEVWMISLYFNCSMTLRIPHNTTRQRARIMCSLTGKIHTICSGRYIYIYIYKCTRQVYTLYNLNVSIQTFTKINIYIILKINNLFFKLLSLFTNAKWI